MVTYQRHCQFLTGERRETMPDAANLNQLRIRFRANYRGALDSATVKAVHPKAVDEALEVAWSHGWRDADWLAAYALEGLAHASVHSPAAVLVSRLREIASQPCPVDDTPTPPRAYVDPAPSGPPARPETIASALAECRKAISR